MWRGARWRASLSVLSITIWLAFILLFAAFWSGGLTLFQSIVVFFASLVLLVGGIGALWAAWGMRFGGPDWEHRG